MNLLIDWQGRDWRYTVTQKGMISLLDSAVICNATAKEKKNTDEGFVRFNGVVKHNENDDARWRWRQTSRTA